MHCTEKVCGHRCTKSQVGAVCTRGFNKGHPFKTNKGKASNTNTVREGQEHIELHAKRPADDWQKEPNHSRHCVCAYTTSSPWIKTLLGKWVKSREIRRNQQHRAHTDSKLSPEHYKVKKYFKSFFLEEAYMAGGVEEAGVLVGCWGVPLPD